MTLTDIVNGIANIGRKTILTGMLLTIPLLPLAADGVPGTSTTDSKTGITYFYEDGHMTGYSFDGIAGEEYHSTDRKTQSSGGSTYLEGSLIGAQRCLGNYLSPLHEDKDRNYSRGLEILQKTTEFIQSELQKGPESEGYNTAVRAYLDTLELFGKFYNASGDYDKTIETLATIEDSIFDDFRFPKDTIDVYTQIVLAYRGQIDSESNESNKTELKGNMINDTFVVPLERFGQDTFLNAFQANDSNQDYLEYIAAFSNDIGNYAGFYSCQRLMELFPDASRIYQKFQDKFVDK